MRRCLNFAAAVKHSAIEPEMKDYLTKFIGTTMLAFDTSMKFTRFIRNLIIVQEKRRFLLETREIKYDFTYRRLKE